MARIYDGRFGALFGGERYFVTEGLRRKILVPIVHGAGVVPVQIIMRDVCYTRRVWSTLANAFAKFLDVGFDIIDLAATDRHREPMKLD